MSENIVKQDLEQFDTELVHILAKIKNIEMLGEARNDLQKLINVQTTPVFSKVRIVFESEKTVKEEVKEHKKVQNAKKKEDVKQKKVMKKQTKNKKRSNFTIKEFIEFYNSFKDTQDRAWFTNALAGKRLVYNKTGFRFIKFYRGHIRLEGLEHVHEVGNAEGWIPIEEKKLEAVLERNLTHAKRLQNLKVQPSEKTIDEVFQYLRKAHTNKKKDSEIKKDLDQFGIKVDNRLMTFDDFKNNMIHIRGFNKKVWVPIEKRENLRFAVILFKRIDEIQEVIHEIKPFGITELPQLVQRKISNGAEITDATIDSLNGFLRGSKRKEWGESVIKAVKLMKTYLKVA